MNTLSMIAPCGVNCKLCLAFQRKKNTCAGCNSESIQKPKHCLQCSIKTCDLLEKTSSGFCYECTKFPCRRLKQLDKRYQTNYSISLIENLQRVEDIGINLYEKSDEKLWHCPQCKKLLCMHKEACLHCGYPNSFFKSKL